MWRTPPYLWLGALSSRPTWYICHTLGNTLFSRISLHPAFFPYSTAQTNHISSLAPSRSCEWPTLDIIVLDKIHVFAIKKVEPTRTLCGSDLDKKHGDLRHSVQITGFALRRPAILIAVSEGTKYSGNSVSIAQRKSTALKATC